MSDIVEAVRGALGLVFAGIMLLFLASAFADANLSPGTIPLNLIAIIAIVGGALVLIAVIARLLSIVLTGSW